MKRLLAILCILVLTYMPAVGHSGPKEDYEEAYQISIAAATSVAAYRGRLGELVRRYLHQDGWILDYYEQAKGHSGARFLLARKAIEINNPRYILAFVGTENVGDIKVDLKVDKVYFAGTNLKEFAANAAKDNVPNTEPKVHRGFNDFVQSGPSATMENAHHDLLSFPDMLLSDKNCKLYLTGHSLGGAAATLTGARMISMGIIPEQLEVITFGAPAVGNAAFAAKFGPVLHLTRVVNSGDPVTGVLQTLVGGYRQFGREIKWNPPDMVADAHQLSGYMDSAMKNYYDKRRQAVQAGVIIPTQLVTRRENHGRGYIVPLKNELPANLTADFRYMEDALQEEYRQTLPDYIIGEQTAEFDAWREAALVSGCQWAITTKVGALRIKQENNAYYITVTVTVYDVATGMVANTATFSTNTHNLTPLEAFMHAFREMSTQLNDRSAKAK